MSHDNPRTPTRPIEEQRFIPAERYTSPRRLLFLIAAAVFLVEAAVMVLLILLPPLPVVLTAPLDAALVTLLMYPILYRFLVRPMTLHIDQRRPAEAALNQAYAEMEARVHERTAELAQSNAALHNEIATEFEAIRQDGSAIPLEAHERLLTEVKTLAQTLQAERDILDTLMENTATQLAYLDRDFNFVRVNSAYARGAGHRREELIGHNHFEWFPNPENQTIFTQVRDTGRPVAYHARPFEFLDQPERGKTYWDWTLVPVKDAAGQTLGVVLSLVDVTQQVRSEEALRQAQAELERRVQERTQELAAANEKLLTEIDERKAIERQLRQRTTAIEAAANGIVITDRQGNIQWINPAFTEITGYSSQEALGQNLRLLKSQEQAPEYFRHLWETIMAGHIWRGELINRRKDGSLYVEEQTIAPVFSERGQIINFVAVKQDVTARKRADEQLHQNNRDLLALSQAERDQRQLAETLAAASLALTQSLDLMTVMETLLDHVGQLVPYDSANVMLLEAESRLTVRVTRGYERWGDAAAVRATSFDVRANPILHELLTTRQSSLVSDVRTQPGWETYQGVEHVRSWLGVPLLAGGRVIGIYSLDKAEPGFFTREHVRKAEVLAGQAAVAVQNAWLFEQLRTGRERLQSLSRRLVEVQEAERQYVARELHDEAGQALTSLMFGLGQLEEQLDSGKRTEQITELRHLTNTIMESLHRLAMDLRPATLDHVGLVPALQQQVKAVGDRFGLAARFKAIGFERERLPPETETALYRIVQEALTNTVRHARATQVTVLLERRGDQVIVIIEDNGLGFGAEPARLPQNGHLGVVGMQERAEMLGGSLTIESSAETGTTIIVEVPDGRSNSDRR